MLKTSVVAGWLILTAPLSTLALSVESNARAYSVNGSSRAQTHTILQGNGMYRTEIRIENNGRVINEVRSGTSSNAVRVEVRSSASTSPIRINETENAPHVTRGDQRTVVSSTLTATTSARPVFPSPSASPRVFLHALWGIFESVFEPLFW